MSWLGRFLDRKGRQSAGGVGAWSSDEEHRANEQLQDAEYRTADPREIVEAEGTAMTGPGGAPQEDSTPEERRREQRGE